MTVLMEKVEKINYDLIKIHFTIVSQKNQKMGL